MHIKLIDGTPTEYSVGKLIKDNPQVSFSKEPSEETLAEYNVYPVTVSPRPSYNAQTQRLTTSDFYEVDSKWHMDFVVTDKPQEEIDAINEQLRAEAYRNESDPLFFKAQRGEIEMQVWLDKVAEIKQRY